MLLVYIIQWIATIFLNVVYQRKVGLRKHVKIVCGSFLGPEIAYRMYLKLYIVNPLSGDTVTLYLHSFKKI